MRLPAAFLLLLTLAAVPAGPLLRGGSPGGLSLEEFRGRLESLLADTGLRRAVVGVCIVRLESGRTVAEVNAGKLLHPASNMKLFTTAAALALLPYDFSFRTNVFCDAARDGGELKGSVYIVGGGDPLLDSLDIDSLAGAVAAAGIGKIAGDIVGDLSLFDTLRWGKGWMWDDEPDPDEAFISPLMFNHSAVSVVVRPAPGAGDPAVCSIFPAGSYFGIENLSKSVAVPTADTLTVTRERGADRFTVGGSVEISARPETTLFSVRYPALHLLHYLRERLASRGIAVGGGIRVGPAAGPVFLGRIERPLAPVIRRVNAVSDNMAAESLLRVIASRASGPPGSAAAGLEAVGAYLRGLGIDPGEIIAADGSGVSWYNAVTPGDIVAVLRDQYSRKGTFGTFTASLARPGSDGTLSSRLTRTSADGRVAAKTGSLTGVSTLSGYLTTASNEMLAFSIMVNHFPGKIQRLRDLQDGILLDLVRLDPAR